MAEEKRGPAPQSDVNIIRSGKKWNIDKAQHEVKKSRGERIIITGPRPYELDGTTWEVWFDPTGKPHRPDDYGRVTLMIPRDTPPAEYKYTVWIKLDDGSEQIIDPKIIIKPPT